MTTSVNNTAGSTDLQLPLLPDPGKHDNILEPAEKLEFTVRLGTSLARGLATDELNVRKQLTTKHDKLSSPDLTPISSRRHTPSPGYLERDEVFEFPSGPEINRVQGRKVSRDTRRVVSRHESENKLRKFSRRESREGKYFNRQESCKDTNAEARRESRKESRRASLIRQTTMLHTYITDREMVNINNIIAYTCIKVFHVTLRLGMT